MCVLLPTALSSDKLLAALTDMTPRELVVCLCVYVSMCVCVCVCERERERE